MHSKNSFLLLIFTLNTTLINYNFILEKRLNFISNSKSIKGQIETDRNEGIVGKRRQMITRLDWQSYRVAKDKNTTYYRVDNIAQYIGINKGNLKTVGREHGMYFLTDAL